MDIKLHTAEFSPEHPKGSPRLVQQEPQEPPQIKEESDVQHLPACKEELSTEQQERSPSLVQEIPERPQIKEEREELLQKPEEAAGSTLTFVAVKSEEDDDNDNDGEKNGETAAVSSTSPEHMKTQAHIEDIGTSQPNLVVMFQCPLLVLYSNVITTNVILSSHRSESDDWKETREGQSALTTLKTQKVEGQRLSLSNDMSQDLKSPKQTYSMRKNTENTMFNCTVCGKGCVTMRLLKEHMRTHSGERPFSCEVCGQCFSCRGNLNKHVTIHTGEKPFMCTDCGKVFRKTSHLKQHMKTHTGEKRVPLICEVCGKGVEKSYLEVHMRTHTGEKPFTCEVCGKGFHCKTNLKNHFKNIHTGKKLFTCIVCDRGFGKKYMQQHMRTHTGEKPSSICTVCGKGCWDLKGHMSTHTGKRSVTCTVCGKAFVKMRDMKVHMRTHTGIKKAKA